MVYNLDQVDLHEVHPCPPTAHCRTATDCLADTLGARYDVDPVWMARVQQVVGWALDRGLVAIINSHHDKWLDSELFFALRLPRCVPYPVDPLHAALL